MCFLEDVYQTGRPDLSLKGGWATQNKVGNLNPLKYHAM